MGAMHERDSDQIWGLTAWGEFRSFDTIMLIVLATSSEVAEKEG